MKNRLLNIAMFILLCGFVVMGLKACDHEAKQNEIKNRQWVQDVKNGKPYTNFGE